MDTVSLHKQIIDEWIMYLFIHHYLSVPGDTHEKNSIMSLIRAH